MKMIFRRLRGALMTGLVWSGAWGLANIGLSALYRVIGLNPPDVPFLKAVPSLFLGGAAFGFLVGIGFSVTLAAAFRHRELREMSVASLSLAGAAVAGVVGTGIALLGGLVQSPIGLAINLGIAVVFGGSTAFGMIKLAKSAPLIPEGGEPLLGHGDSQSLVADPVRSNPEE